MHERNENVNNSKWNHFSGHWASISYTSGKHMLNRTFRYVAGFGLLLAAVLLMAGMNLVLGSASLSVGDSIGMVLKQDTVSTAGKIIWSIRLPRLVGAMMLGGLLSVSGFLLQTFFANPIAGPYVLGISSGAKMTVAFAMICCMEYGISLSSGYMILAAFAGSLLSMGFVLLIAGKVKKMSVLIVCGVMIGYICSAITDFAVTFADDSNIVNLHNWSLGSFSGLTWDNNRMIFAVALFGMICSILLAKPMNAFQLGETYARNMGVRIGLFRAELILISSLLSATVTAFAGPVSFVGIAVPQLMKGLFRTAKPLIMIPACFLGGSAFCLFCDVIARCLFAPTELSISSVTAIFGAPVVIYLMVRRKKGDHRD